MSMFLFEHPEEQRVVGSILTRYGDLEYQWSQCLGKVLKDQEAAVRSLFRLRGGNVRIQVADAILRPAMDTNGLKDCYDAALGAIRYSTTIRNQYAHCHWFHSGEENSLYFTDLQKAATTSTGSLLYGMRHVDIPLLELQKAYLEYCSDWLWYLQHEYPVRTGQLANHIYKAPKIIGQPPLHNPIGEHPLPKRVIDDLPPQEEHPQE
jgi:hypothetical protein